MLHKVYSITNLINHERRKDRKIQWKFRRDMREEEEKGIIT